MSGWLQMIYFECSPARLQDKVSRQALPSCSPRDWALCTILQLYGKLTRNRVQSLLYAGGYHTEPETHRSRPDLCFPIACLTTYALTIFALLYAVYYKMQVTSTQHCKFASCVYTSLAACTVNKRVAIVCFRLSILCCQRCNRSFSSIASAADCIEKPQLAHTFSSSFEE